MGSDERRQQEPRAADPADNVVRFPRNWIGPLEELVPFGPSAERATAAEAPTLSADAFWGEDAGSLHAVMQAPRAAGVSDSNLPAPLRAEPPMSAQPPMSAAAAGVVRPGSHARARLASALRRGRRGPGAVAVFLVVALLAVVVAPVVSSLRGHRSDVRKSLADARSRDAAARSRGTEEPARARQSGVGGAVGISGGKARRSLLATTSSARTNRRSRGTRAARARARALAHSRPIVGASAAAAADPQPQPQLQSSTQSSQSSTQSSQNSNQSRSSTYTQAATSGVSAVSGSQIRAASGSSGAIAGTDGSSHLDSASPLPVPGGPPAP
jgi:hypothetical protein